MSGIRIPLILILVGFAGYAISQYPPAAGQEGSTAIKKDSSAIVEWATDIRIQRGWMDIAVKDKRVKYGEEKNALGPADGTVVSLGDSGIAILRFEHAIVDEEGPDFAVYENSFDDHFLELAHVEISSDGEHYFRIPSVSLTDTVRNIGSFGSLDPKKIHNLAGKYRALYGTPFDINDIPDAPELDKTRIQYIKIIDVVGDVEGPGRTRDSRGFPINDPYPTPFATGGFDLDAVAVLHSARRNANKEVKPGLIPEIYPNPIASDVFHIRYQGSKIRAVTITNSEGQVVYHFIPEKTTSLTINCKDWSKGLYFIQLQMPSGHNQLLRMLRL